MRRYQEEQPELAVSAPQRWHQLLKLPTPWETNYGPGDLHRGTHPDHLSRKRSRFHCMNSYSFLEKGNHFLRAIANLLFLFCSYKFFFSSLRLWGMYLWRYCLMYGWYRGLYMSSSYYYIFCLVGVHLGLVGVHKEDWGLGQFLYNLWVSLALVSCFLMLCILAIATAAFVWVSTYLL